MSSRSQILAPNQDTPTIHDQTSQYPPYLISSQHTGLSIYNVLVLATIGVPMSFILTDTTQHYAIQALFLFFATTVTLCFVFIPKVGNFIFQSSNLFDTKAARLSQLILRSLAVRGVASSSPVSNNALVNIACALNSLGHVCWTRNSLVINCLVETRTKLRC